MTAATVLLRQIHPHWIANGRVTSQAFKPTRKDEKRLSTEDGDRTSAQEAFERYTLKHESCGVMGVTVQQCHDKNLSVKSAPNEESEYHTEIDFGACTKKQVKDNASLLTVEARKRGWLYLPPK